MTKLLVPRSLAYFAVNKIIRILALPMVEVGVLGFVFRNARRVDDPKQAPQKTN